MVNDCMTIMVDWLMMIDYGCTWSDYDLPRFDYVLPKLNMINYKCAWFLIRIHCGRPYFDYGLSNVDDDLTMVTIAMAVVAPLPWFDYV